MTVNNSTSGFRMSTQRLRFIPFPSVVSFVLPLPTRARIPPLLSKRFLSRRFLRF